ncbi:hypothetical protein BCAR13_1190006 [Paraburkholderia caribensis]|nr:hypothetical protein BCAR13_1190006 [Paraburkholderia caribensis]
MAAGHAGGGVARDFAPLNFLKRRGLTRRTKSTRHVTQF